MVELDTLTFDELCENLAFMQRFRDKSEQQIKQSRLDAQHAAAAYERGDLLYPGFDDAYNADADYHTTLRDLCVASVVEYEKEIDNRRAAMRLALFQSLHPRLGLNSPLHVLSPDIVTCLAQTI